MRTILAIPLGLLVTLSLAAQRKNDPSPEPPPDKPTGPVTARLVARKTTHTLDRLGLTPQQYREAIRAGRVGPPTVDLVLELVNTSKEDLQVRIAGAAPKLTLHLKGKEGIETRSAKRVGKGKLTYQNLKPGEKYSMPLTSLTGYSSSAKEEQTFWTEPGEYTLEATFRTYVYASGVNPVGGKGVAGKRPPVGAKSAIFELKSNAVQLSVKAK